MVETDAVKRIVAVFCGIIDAAGPMRPRKKEASVVDGLCRHLHIRQLCSDFPHKLIYGALKKNSFKYTNVAGRGESARSGRFTRQGFIRADAPDGNVVTGARPERPFDLRLRGLDNVLVRLGIVIQRGAVRVSASRMLHRLAPSK